MVNATFRFYDKLNEFLPPARRGRDFSCACAQNATTKHMVEALGVPHGEVAMLLLNGEEADFDVILRDGDRLAVYPKFEAFGIAPLWERSNQGDKHGDATGQAAPRFAADAHLGGLARMLRMAGFDTLYDNGIGDAELAACCEREGRIVLTRDRDLLKRRAVTRGCYIRSLKAEQQLAELVGRLDIAQAARPFSLCLRCNAPLRTVDKSEVRERLPQRVRELHQRFQTCEQCQGVFWQGTHWQRMVAVLAAAGIGAGTAPS